MAEPSFLTSMDQTNGHYRHCLPTLEREELHVLSSATHAMSMVSTTGHDICSIPILRSAQMMKNGARKQQQQQQIPSTRHYTPEPSMLLTQLYTRFVHQCTLLPVIVAPCDAALLSSFYC